MCTAKLASTGSSYSQPHTNSLPPRRVRPTPIVCNEFLRHILSPSLRLRICKGVQTAVSNSGITTGRLAHGAHVPSTLIWPGDGNCWDAREAKGGPIGVSQADAASVALFLSLNPQNCANFRPDLRWNEKTALAIHWALSPLAPIELLPLFWELFYVVHHDQRCPNFRILAVLLTFRAWCTWRAEIMWCRKYTFATSILLINYIITMCIMTVRPSCKNTLLRLYVLLFSFFGF